LVIWHGEHVRLAKLFAASIVTTRLKQRDAQAALFP